jgi:hypothetical protein
MSPPITWPFKFRDSVEYLREKPPTSEERAEINKVLIGLDMNSLEAGFPDVESDDRPLFCFDRDKKRFKKAQLEGVLPFIRGNNVVDRRTMGAGKTLTMAVAIKVLLARKPTGVVWLLDPTRDLIKDHGRRFEEFGFTVEAYDPQADDANLQRVPQSSCACSLPSCDISFSSRNASRTGSARC